MPRKNRGLVDGSYYHIVVRGNDKRKLFRAKQDYQWFLALIREYRQKHPISILHYCLMPNHFHVLIKTIKAEHVPKFMQGLLQKYGAGFRSKYGSVGYLFQNRYNSRIIESEGYLIECARYIERNPLRAGLVKDIADYCWSSFQFYANGKPDAIINLLNPMYESLGFTIEERRCRYAERVREWRPYERIVDQAFRIP
ncbi:MAG: transposase [Candidatus Omnitrophota bacterium]|jgi:putative transposase|nr:MAG: transposase [Candidatus Omnitrophota bacterium]